MPGRLADTERVVVDVGTGFYVEKVCLVHPWASKPLIETYAMGFARTGEFRRKVGWALDEQGLMSVCERDRVPKKRRSFMRAR